MYCRNCKALIKDKALYCPLCGKPLGPVSGEILHDYRNGIPAMTENIQRTEKKMRPRTAAMLSYVFLIGPMLSYIWGDRKDNLVLFHLNQSIALQAIYLAIMLLPFPEVLQNISGWILLACRIYGVFDAYHQRTKGIPYIRDIKLIKTSTKGTTG